MVEQVLAFVGRDHEVHGLVKSAVAHYEIACIHPFSDGNGRRGRLWQHVMLLRVHPLFEFVPVESVVRARQDEYYAALRTCDRAGRSTVFIEFSLGPSWRRCRSSPDRSPSPPGRSGTG